MDTENLKNAIAELCAQYGYDAVLAEVGTHRKISRLGRPALTSEQKNERLELGAWLTKTRTDLKLTQAELAEKLGVTKAAISCWEHGGRKVPVERIKLALSITA